MLREDESLFFVSVLEKPRNLEEISKIWDLDRTIFYKYDTANSLLQKRLIKLEKIEKAGYFSVNFEGYALFFKNLLEKDENIPSRKIYLELFKEVDKLIIFLKNIEENLQLRKKLWSIEKIFLLSKNQKDWRDYNNSLALPISTITSIIVLTASFVPLEELMKGKDSLEKWEYFKEKILEKVKEPLSTTFIISPLQTMTKTNLNIFLYLEALFKELTFDDFLFLSKISNELTFYKELLQNYKEVVSAISKFKKFL